MADFVRLQFDFGASRLEMLDKHCLLSLHAGRPADARPQLADLLEVRIRLSAIERNVLQAQSLRSRMGLRPDQVADQAGAAGDDCQQIPGLTGNLAHECVTEGDANCSAVYSSGQGGWSRRPASTRPKRRGDPKRRYLRD